MAKEAVKMTIRMILAADPTSFGVPFAVRAE